MSNDTIENRPNQTESDSQESTQAAAPILESCQTTYSCSSQPGDSPENADQTQSDYSWEPVPPMGFCGLSGILSSPELKKLSKNWFPFLLLGTTLLVLGFLSIGSSFFVTILTVAIIGVLLMVGGIMQVVNSFYTGRWSGFLLHLGLGLLYLVVGFMLLDAPTLNAITLTFLLAAFFIVAGLFRMIASIASPMPGWGWTLFNGIITFLLGVLIYKHWPSSGLWVIGLFVGIEMVFSGWYWILFSTGLRNWTLTQQAASSPA